MYAVVDVETTGGRLAEDRVIEVAIVIHDGEKITEKYSSLVNPGRPIDPFVQKLTGIGDKMVSKAPAFHQVQDEILRLTEGAIFVAHNVRFDFNILRNEFRRLGVSFDKKQLDTINLAKKAFPGFSSYGLDNLCNQLEIANRDRHRALGDAEATAVLLHRILQREEAERWISMELSSGLDTDQLPVQLPLTELEKLPEIPGIYWFVDAAGQAIFCQHAKNLRLGAYQHLLSFKNSTEEGNPFQTTVQIDFEPAPSELIAKLMFTERVMSESYAFTKPVKTMPRIYGIRPVADERGALMLKLERITDETLEYPLSFHNYSSARKALGDLLGKSGLYASQQLLKRITGEPDPVFLQAHNQKVQKALMTYYFPYASFLLIGEGLHPGEKSVIWVDRNEYRGFGYYMPDSFTGDALALTEKVKPQRDHSESRKVIRQHLRKGKKLKIVALG